MKKEYNKLVRDKIPHILGDKEVTSECIQVSGEELMQRLKDKLQEEALEVYQATRDTIAEEIADVQEVLDALIQLYDLDPQEIRKIQEEKRKKRGGFSEGIVLLSTEE